MEDTSKASPEKKKSSDIKRLFLTVIGMLVASFLIAVFVSGSWALLFIVCCFVFLYFRTSDYSKNTIGGVVNLLSLPVLLGFVLLVLSPFIFDWGFLNGEITEYSIISCSECEKEKMALGKRTFKPSISQQKVAEMGITPIEVYSNCMVLDRENWDCAYNDGSGKFGFSEGNYWCDDPKTEEWVYLARPIWLYYKIFSFL